MMRNILRNWLGVARLEETVGKLPSEEELRKLIANIICKQHIGVSGRTDAGLCPLAPVDTGDAFIRKAVRSETYTAVQNVVAGEKFIDSIVARIKAKQLT